MSKRLVLVANPKAGVSAMNIVRATSNRRRIVANAVREFRAAGYVVRLHVASELEAIEECSAQATREGADIIVAAGGDGTINAVLNGMMRVPDAKPALGVLPL